MSFYRPIPFVPDRAALVRLRSAGIADRDGEVTQVGDDFFQWSSNATAVPALPGLLPLPVPVFSLEQFGADPTPDVDNADAFAAATDYLASIGGGTIQLKDGKTYESSFCGFDWSKVTLRGHGPRRGGLKAHADADGTVGWLYNTDIGTGSNRLCLRPRLFDMDLDGYDLPFHRWLSQADDTPVTDPEADYVMGTGALASGITGTSLTAVLTDEAVSSVTINDGGAGWFGHSSHPYGRTLRLTITGNGTGAFATCVINEAGEIVSTNVDRPGSGYTSITISCSGVAGESLTGNLVDGSLASITINTAGSGGDVENTVLLHFNGGGGAGAYGYGTVSGGTITSITMVRGGTGYTSPPTVTVAGGYADIALLITPAVDRRNPLYTDASAGVFFNRTIGAHVENVRFLGFRRMTLGEGGGLNTIFRNLEFIDCGKNDDAMHCIWTQVAGASSTENILIEGVIATQGIERSAVAFMPQRGGTLRGLVARGCGESTIFINGNANISTVQDYHILIEDCTISGNYVTDLVGHGIEINGADNVTIRGCTIEGTAETAINAPGCVRLLVEGCTFVECFTALTETGDQKYPYKPFAERWGYNNGERPEAGKDISITNGAYLFVGTLGGVGCKANVYRGNHFVDARSVHAGYVMSQVKSGGNSLSQGLDFVDNDLTRLPQAMRDAIINTAIGTVWQAHIPLRIANNRGHASMSPVVVEQDITGTGYIAFDVGFRPSLVTVEAELIGGADIRSSRGEISWVDSTVAADQVARCQSKSMSTSAVASAKDDENIIRLLNPSGGAVTSRVEFVRWTETGVDFTCPTLGETINARWTFHP
ncbi:MAG: hypothetical protein CML66_25940 [Rhodobacteraceae bacterium]|nr:hypothetical protein [Paracoccaceae bacterium]MAY43902.1 hypothetical protein [Paracoccaceae bacterium]